MSLSLKQRLLQSDYNLDPVTGVWSPPGFQSLDYSDGKETEQRLQKIIDVASDISSLSPELRRQCVDWPTTYHLSGLRANILRPFEITEHHDVLEVGAGCGALTRYLGECGASVLALEGSLRRADIARSRTRNLDNVQVLAERFSMFKTTQKFDVVTLIGVLEYAKIDSVSENAAQAMLTHVASFLKPNGVVILAIENQLGLKYFAGAPEDHIGRPMVGLEGGYEKTQLHTYGYKDLVSLLSFAGLNETVFMAPFPDYKLPISIVTESGMNCEGFDASVFAWQSVKRDLQLPDCLNFAPEKVWPEIFRNDLGLDLTNSFLVVGGFTRAALPDTKILAWHYSTGRAPQYCRETQFQIEQGKEILVSYRCLSPNSLVSGNDGSLVTFKCPEKTPYTLGQPLSQEFFQLIGRDGWTFAEIGRFIERYATLFEDLLDRDGCSLKIEDFRTMIPGRYMDVIPQNIVIRNDGIPVIIDNEWTLNTDMEFGHFIVRSLVLMIGLVTRYGIPNFGRTYSRGTFIKFACRSSRFTIDKLDIKRYIELEAEIQAEITNQCKLDLLNWSPDNLLVTHNTQTLSDERAREIEAIRNSTSWKVTGPLRTFVELIRRKSKPKIFSD